MRILWCSLVLWAFPGVSFAQEAGGAMAASLVAGPLAGEARGAPGSLFVGRAKGGLFAPWVRNVPEPEPASLVMRGVVGPGGGQIARLRDLIASAEAGRAGYDAVQYGARIKPPRRPTDLSLAEIDAWTRATPRQPHAIGRYQFIPKTLRRLVGALGLPPDTRFTPDVQDKLADLLLAEAGLAEFLSGDLPRVAFMNNLAKIWAGLPNATGRSHYHGFAGNKAVISWPVFEAGMVEIFG